MSSVWDDLQGSWPPPPLLARYRGRCAACRRPFPPGTAIAFRDGWAHAQCPRQPKPEMTPQRETTPRPTCYLCAEPVPEDDEYASPKGTTAHLSCVTGRPTRT